jgi:hypothetical protein
MANPKSRERDQDEEEERDVIFREEDAPILLKNNLNFQPREIS